MAAEDRCDNVLRACLVAGVFIQVAGAAAAPAPRPNHPLPILPRLGDYLDTAYIQALQKTHSPLAAAHKDSRARIPQMVTVQRQGSARRFAASYDWHTGTLLLVLQRDGTIHREMAWGPDPTMALRVTGVDSFCLAARRGPEHCYRYTQNVAALVGGITLAGTYVDRQGGAYRFTADGHAHFPGYDFNYAPVLDQAEAQYDAFCTSEGRLMAFQRNGSLLTLYAVASGQPEVVLDEAHKVAVLRAVSRPRLVASR